MNAPSCRSHKCSHRLLQHIGRHLTQMCFDDGSSFFPTHLCVSSFFPPFPQYAEDLLDKQVKNIIQSQPGLETEDGAAEGSEFFGCGFFVILR